jgi:hypothetical protein
VANTSDHVIIPSLTWTYQFDYDNGEDDNANPSIEKPLQDLFYEEAKRHAEATVQKRSLPSIQFMAVQWM